MPWNFPFLLCGWGIGPAMAAGNTCVVKPAEDTPLSTLYVAHLAREIGIPDGVIKVIPGVGEVTGAALSRNPNLCRMSFTGSPEVGRMVARDCGHNLIPVKIELGSKGAAVIFDDVDMPEAADKLAQAITFHAGQVCCDATPRPPVPRLSSRVAPRKSRAAKAATTSSRPCSPARWTTSLHARRFLARWPTSPRSATRAKVSA